MYLTVNQRNMPSSPLESQVKLFLVVGGRIISAASWVGIIPLFQTAGERSASKEVYHTQSKIIVSFNSYLPISYSCEGLGKRAFVQALLESCSALIPNWGNSYLYTHKMEFYVRPLKFSVKQELLLKPFLCCCVLPSLTYRTSHVLMFSLSPFLGASVNYHHAKWNRISWQQLQVTYRSNACRLWLFTETQASTSLAEDAIILTFLNVTHVQP